MPLSIRPATLADEEAVLTLIEELWEPPGRRPPDYTRERASAGFRYAVQNSDADVLVAVKGDVIVGLASVYAIFPSIGLGRRCWLEELVVASSRRSQGIGALLLQTATKWARERGCTHLQLDSALGRKDAHRFFLAQGMAQDSLLFSRRIG